MANILIALINASEIAANVARSCCTGSTGESLLITEKCEGEANARFDTDFKTIADVLAQEAAKSEIVSYYPELTEHLRGEECSEINGVCIKLQDNFKETAKLLNMLVPQSAAEKMANAAHSSPNISVDLPEDLQAINTEDLGVWIDPIDGTAEFIAGVQGKADSNRGLPCVTVLIGAYLRSTGVPVIGVINQPFFNDGKGRIVWGVSYGNIQKWSQNHTINSIDNNIVLMSAAEDTSMMDKFKASGWEVESVPGAGYKLLKVALGEASAYIVTKGTTFRWDTCAPHAILRAKGGDVLSYHTFAPVTYNDPMYADTQQYCNCEGIVAYSNADVLDRIKSILKI